MIKIKRIYEQPSEDDGYRILVDRIWPRGISKEFASLNEWNKTITPSPELRIWFNHLPERFEAFSEMYRLELTSYSAELSRIKLLANNQNVTLLYAAKDPHINHAVILLDVLNKL
ncbi:DUF488 domain-containing protein [Paludibacter sp.]